MALNNHVENFTLDMAPGGIAPVLNVSQGDTGRAYTADMYWGGASYDVSGLTVRLRGRKRDNTVFDYALPAPSGTKVAFDLEDKEQVTIIPGNVECELVFTDSNSLVVGTANFVIIVEEAPYDPNAISESEVTGLVDLISDQIGGAVDEWMETEAPTSPEFAAAIQGATDTYLDENGVVIEYENIQNNPVESYVVDLANGEDVYKRTNLDGFVMGNIHNANTNIEHPASSTNTAYFPQYFEGFDALYFDDENYNIIVCGFDETYVYTNNSTITSSPVLFDTLKTVVKNSKYQAIEIRNKSSSTLDVASANASGAYINELIAYNNNDARFLMLTSEISDLKLTGQNLMDDLYYSNRSGVTETETGFHIDVGGYLFNSVELSKMSDKMFLAFNCETDNVFQWCWASSSLSAIQPYYNIGKRGNVHYTYVEKSTAPENAVYFLLRIDNRNKPTAIDVSKIILASGVYSSAIGGDTSAVETVYVSPNGSDQNSGATRNTAFKTIQSAINSGAKKILVREGTYPSFYMSDLVGVSIELDRYYDTFTAGTDEDNPKIIIDGNNTTQTGISIVNCYDCHFDSIEVKNCTLQGWRVNKCSGLRFDDCLAHDIAVEQTSGGGFVITSTDADFYNCGCYNIGTDTASTDATYHIDGFNIHLTGTTNFINCWAYNCLEDGISHHDACCGFIDGGEWYGCGKGGIASPTHGAHIDVKNAYCHDNSYGIYAYATGSGMVAQRAPINITNCVCKNNRSKDIGVGSYYTANVWNCIYSTYEGFTPLT